MVLKWSWFWQIWQPCRMWNETHDPLKSELPGCKEISLDRCEVMTASTIWFIALCLLNCFLFPLPHWFTFPLLRFCLDAPVVRKDIGLQLVSNLMTVTLTKPPYLNLCLRFWQFRNTKVLYFHIHVWCMMVEWPLLWFSVFSPFSGVFLSCRRVQVTIKRDHRTGCEVKGHVITQAPERKTRAVVRHHATLLLLAQMHCND